MQMVHYLILNTLMLMDLILTLQSVMLDICELNELIYVMSLLVIIVEVVQHDISIGYNMIHDILELHDRHLE